MVGSVLPCVDIIMHKEVKGKNKMQEYYIQAPLKHHEITLIECKAKRIKPAKRNDVPEQYRKNPVAKFKNWLFNTKREILSMFRGVFYNDN